jgi:hypothetical protein
MGVHPGKTRLLIPADSGGALRRWSAEPQNRAIVRELIGDLAGDPTAESIAGLAALLRLHHLAGAATEHCRPFRIWIISNRLDIAERSLSVFSWPLPVLHLATAHDQDGLGGVGKSQPVGDGGDFEGAAPVRP